MSLDYILSVNFYAFGYYHSKPLLNTSLALRITADKSSLTKRKNSWVVGLLLVPLRT